MAKPEAETRYYTGECVEVTARIKKGITKFFVNIKLAECIADKKRSYKYEVFDSSTPGVRKLIGYAVPA